jgi:hypothetical protein
MDATIDCTSGPAELLRAIPCVLPLSKRVRGELVPLGAEREECPELRCVNLTTAHAARARVDADECDAEALSRLDGVLRIERLTTVFADGDPGRRGIHAADVVWVNRGMVIEGRMHGVTNAGLLHDPLPDACEECEHRGTMTGRLCGHITRIFHSRELEGALVDAVYRFAFEPSREGGEGELVGTIEGAVVVTCGPQE